MRSAKLFTFLATIGLGAAAYQTEVLSGGASAGYCVGEILQQGACITCWAMATTSVLRDRACYTGTDPGTLSPQTLITMYGGMSSCSSADKCQNNGWSSGTALSPPGQTGQGPLESFDNLRCLPLMPCSDYTASDNTVRHCGAGCNPSTCGCGGSTCPGGCYTSGYVGGYAPYTNKCSDGSTSSSAGICGTGVQKLSSMSDAELQTEIYNNGPVSMTVNFPQDLAAGASEYLSGSNCLYSGNGGGGILHDIKVIGYDDDGNWIAANSFGDNWGSCGGFFTLPTSYVERDFTSTTSVGQCQALSVCQLDQATACDASSDDDYAYGDDAPASFAGCPEAQQLSSLDACKQYCNGASATYSPRSGCSCNGGAYKTCSTQTAGDDDMGGTSSYSYMQTPGKKQGDSSSKPLSSTAIGLSAGAACAVAAAAVVFVKRRGQAMPPASEGAVADAGAASNAAVPSDAANAL